MSSLFHSGPCGPSRADMRRRTPVTIFAGTNSCGELMLLFTDDAIEQTEREMASEFAGSLTMLRGAGFPPEEVQARWADYLARREVCLNAYLHERAVALPNARFYEFVLVLPLLSQWQKIVDELYRELHATAAEEGPSPQAGQDKEAARLARTEREARQYQKRLLENGLETPGGQAYTPEQIDALDPLLVSTLGTWIAQQTDASPLRKMLMLPCSDATARFPDSVYSAPCVPINDANAAVTISMEVEGLAELQDALNALTTLADRLKRLCLVTPAPDTKNEESAHAAR